MFVVLYGEPALYVKAVGNYLLEIQYFITNYTAKLVYQRSMVLLADPGGYSLCLYMGGPCQYLGSEIVQKQSYLGSVKNSYKKVNIWGLRITVNEIFNIWGLRSDNEVRKEKQIIKL